MKQEDVTQCIQKYVAGKASSAEVKSVDEWYHSFEDRPGYTDGLAEAEKEVLMQEQFSSFLKAVLKDSGTF